MTVRTDAAVPIPFVRDVRRTAAFRVAKPGLACDFPARRSAFLRRSVARVGAANIAPRARPHFFAELATRDEALLLATGDVRDVHPCSRHLRRAARGRTDFPVRDPDGNVPPLVRFG